MTLILTMIFEHDTKNIVNKSKNRQVGLHQTEKFLCGKGNNQDSENDNLYYGRKYL